MLKKEIENTLRDILKNEIALEVQVEQLKIDDELADYGLNSKGVLQLMMGIEEKFKIEFTDEDFDYKKFQTLKSLISYVEGKMVKLDSN